MSDVSCRVFEVFARPLAQKRVPEWRLVRGTNVSIAALRDRGKRISWCDFAAIMRNLGEIFSEDELVEIGREHLRSPLTQFASVVARMLFSPMEFYEWTFKPGSGLGNQWFTCVQPACSVLSATELEVRLTLPTGFDVAWEFFLLSKGNFIEMPRLVGYPPAKVGLERIENGGRYWIVVADGASIATRARRAVLWPVTARAAARELKKAHEELRERFDQLDNAREILDRQATQLRTAHAVSESIHGELDLARTLDAVSRALVVEAAFLGAEVRLDVETDDLRLLRVVHHGAAVADGADACLTRALHGRAGQRLGEVCVRTAPGADAVERDELLSFITPTLAMAIDNAVSYHILEDYRRGLERRVDERTSELSHARDELAASVRSLEEAREARERIFANVNHELRTPLSLILLTVGQLQKELNGAAGRTVGTSLATIEQNARRLMRMVDDLLLLAEGREGEIRLWLAPCEVGDVAERVVDSWAAAAVSAGITLSSSVAARATVRADRDALERILTNLLSNAMKFTPRGGAIHVRVDASDRRAWLEVQDTGIGIDDELRRRLFGRFERGRQSINGTVNGSGLGLSLVKELVAAHGGTIDVENAPNGGSLFRVGLPIALDSAPPTMIMKSPSLAPGDFGVAPSTHDGPAVYEPKKTATATLLLAEDEPDLRARIAELLSDEYKVVAAPNGAEALRLAQEHRPDLLITDIQMPEMDGVELTRRFRALAGNRVAPVLLLTALGGIGDRLQGFDAGAVDYILKPFEPAELRARVRSQLALRALALQLLETEKLAALGTLSAGLAHEMRNPANGIVNAVHPFRELLPPELVAPGTGTGELLNVIEKCSEQIAGLSRQLLGFRRGAVLDKRNVPLEQMLRRVRKTAQPALQGVELRERYEYTGPVPCAEPLMAQVFANLLENAAHAAGRGGWVEVRSSVEGDRVVVEFSDSGPGVPKELRERIFEPFFTTKPPGSGSGLGLSTAREIVSRHGGSLDLKESGDRAVFRIEVPLAAA